MFKNRFFDVLFFLALLGVVAHIKMKGTLHERVPASFQEDVSCNIYEMAEKIQQGTKTPAPFLYHYGRKEVLLKDVEAHTVPLDDWNQFVMGSKTRFGLKPFRRGLYGTERLEDADKYGDSKFNWLIEIKLKETCLKPESVSSLEGIPQQPKFKEWYETTQQVKKTKLDLNEWIKECFSSSGQANPQKFEYYYSSEHSQTVCESTLEDYWNENQIKIVHDTQETRSWYIRDRGCIEDIQGTDEFWANRFLTLGTLWENQCDLYRTHQNAARVWFLSLSALKESELKMLNFDALKPLLSKYRMPLSLGDKDFSVYDFSEELARSKKRCEAVNKVSEWKDELMKISNEVEDLYSNQVNGRLRVLCQ